MHYLLFPDDRPCTACRPCSFNYALFARSDVVPILLRVRGESLADEYLELTRSFPQFQVDPSGSIAEEVGRFRRWAAAANLFPSSFCCMSEPRQEFWHAFARSLGLPSLPSEVIHALRHKPTMKCRIRAIGLQTADFAEVDSAEDVIRFAEKQGYPVVIKPVDGWGALATFVVRDRRELQGIPPSVWQRHMMVETFVGDREYECCALIQEGRVLGVFPSLMPAPPVEAARGAINANISLAGHHDEVPVDDLHGLVQTLASGFGLDRGYLHLELFAAADRHRVVIGELALRYPGCEIAKNHALAYGFDIANVTLDLYLGLAPRINYGRMRCVGDLLLPYRHGRVAAVSAKEQLEKLAGVIEVHIGVKVGEHLPAVECASFNCAGWAFVEGDSPAQVQERMTAVLKEFCLETDAAEAAAAPVLVH
jgi:hypothetical protein